MWRILTQVAAVLVCGLGVFAALRGSPYLQELPFVPEWAGHWLDAYGNLRHLVGYAIVTLVVGWAFSGIRPPRAWFKLALLVGGSAALLEIIQAWLPQRHADVLDVACSWAGVGLGWLAGVTFSQGTWRKKNPA